MSKVIELINLIFDFIKGNEFINKDAYISTKLYLRNREWDHQGK